MEFIKWPKPDNRYFQEKSLLKKILIFVIVGIFLLYLATYLSIDKEVRQIMNEIAQINEISLEPNYEYTLNKLKETYDEKLTSQQQQQVKNYSVLEEARAKLLVSKINSIETVELDDQTLICDLEDWYNSLEPNYQNLVENYSVLESAQNELDYLLYQAEHETTDSDENNNIDSSTPSLTHTCVVSGCYKDGTYEWTGIAGQTEWYCYEHYQSMLNIIGELYSSF